MLSPMPIRQEIHPSILNDIISRIVEVAGPEQIILFGSGARGTMGGDSDLDLLVVKRGRYNPRKVTSSIYMRMRGIMQAMDIVLVTPAQIAKYRNCPWSVICPALQEGMVIYDRNTVT